MARVGISEAAARLGLSVDSIRRRVRKGELTAQRDNKGVWWVEVADGAVPMQAAPVPMLAPPYAVPMQPPGEANGHDADRELVEVLRAQVADLTRRLDQADDDHRAERAAWHEERGRLLALVERLPEREAEGNGLNRVKSIGADAAERRAAELQDVIDGELAGLRALVSVHLAQSREQTRAADSVPAPESQRRVRPRRRWRLW